MPWFFIIVDCIEVAVGLLIKNHKVLIAQRPERGTYGGFWEFPGGKIEADESASTALVRELVEEINVKPLAFHCIQSVDYAEKNYVLRLWFYEVTLYKGRPRAREQQQRLQWVNLFDLPNYTFPPANLPVITRLRQRTAKCSNPVMDSTIPYVND